MLRSMTAFGRGQASGQQEDFLVEIHSVNSRRLEIVVNASGQLTEFDPLLRKFISGSISRGRVAVYVSSQPAYGRATLFRANTDLAKQLKGAYDELSKALGYKDRVDFSVIASQPDIIVPAESPGDPQDRWSVLKAAAEGALAKLIAMKETEGSNLRKIFEDSLAELEKTVDAIQKTAPAALRRHTERLKERIQQAASPLPDDEERILREIVILADKLDVSEEIARLQSHIQQFRALIDGSEPCGRTMDFLIQEMSREINTIGAKGDDLTISRLVVHAKTELEKMREQGQNIE